MWPDPTPEPTPLATERTIKLFDLIFSAMGLILLGLAGWIGHSVSRIPVIEQELTDYIHSSDKRFDDNDTVLKDHEVRIRTLEKRR